MALDPLTGETYDLQIVGGRRSRGGDVSHPVKLAKFKYTATSTGTGIASMGILPAGPIRIINNLSGITQVTASDAAEVITVGYAAYTNSAGTAVAADVDAFALDIATPTVDPSAGAGPTPFNLPAIGYSDFNTRDGLTITMTISGGSITATEVAELLIAYIELG